MPLPEPLGLCSNDKKRCKSSLSMGWDGALSGFQRIIDVPVTTRAARMLMKV
jgi:hypothetical protein